MLVLGLDPSLTNYGWALHCPLETGKARCPLRGRWKTKPKMLEVSRYMYMRDQLQALIQEHQPDHVCIESPIFGAQYSEGMYGLFLYSQEAIYRERKDLVLLSVSQIKKHARLSLDLPSTWNMMKPNMVEAAKEDSGGKGHWNHNEADAYLCARLGAKFWLLQDGIITPDELTEFEHATFLHTHTYTRGERAGETDYKGLVYREGDRFHLWSRVTNGKEES